MRTKYSNKMKLQLMSDSVEEITIQKKLQETVALKKLKITDREIRLKGRYVSI